MVSDRPGRFVRCIEDWQEKVTAWVALIIAMDKSEYVWSDSSVILLIGSFVIPGMPCLDAVQAHVLYTSNNC